MKPAQNSSRSLTKRVVELVSRPTTVLAVSVTAALYLFGCGGSGGGTGTTSPTAEPLSLTVSWPALSGKAPAAITPPSAASSLVVTLKGAGDSGADFVFAPSISRDPTKLSSYSQTYRSSNKAHLGNWKLHVDFFSGNAGAGSVVATADSTANLTSSGANLGTVTPASTITVLTITPVPTLAVGGSESLSFTAHDKSGAIVGVAPGAAAWSLTSANHAVSMTAAGLAKGLTTGSDNVKVTLDGLVATTSVTVTGSTNFVAEATLDANGNPVVGFDTVNLTLPNNADEIERQVFRNDVTDGPVGAIDDNFQAQFVDTPSSRSVTFLTPLTGSCPSTISSTKTEPGFQVGHPYLYRIHEIYRIPQIDLPIATTGSSAGTTGQTTTGGGECYFSQIAAESTGLVTPLGRGTLVAPAAGSEVLGTTVFSFSSAVTDQTSFFAGYVVQLCSTPDFNQATTVTSAVIKSSDTGTLSYTFPPRSASDTFLQFLRDHFGSVTKIYWRVGAQNTADVPGPQTDEATNLRYIFSLPSSFTIPKG